MEDVTIAEGNTSATLTLTGLHPGPGENSQMQTVTAFSGTPSLLANPSVTLNDNGTATTLFSPNGDGANDVLRVRTTGLADIRFCVYSADGHEVFRTTDINEATETGWNGRYHGRDMPAGTYTWTLYGHFTDGNPLTFGKHAY